MNYTEVELLYNQFIHITRYINFLDIPRASGRHILTEYSLIEALGVTEIPLYDFFFLVYENNVLEWNDFFRFVMFYGFGPMPSIFYCIKIN